MLEDIEFRLRVRVDDHSPEATMLNYLNSKQTLYPARDMAMIALMSYWLPLAYEADGLQAREKIERTIRASIYRLKLHLQDLQQMLGEETLGKEVIAVDSKSPESPLATKPQLLKAEENTSSRPEVNIAELEEVAPQKEEWFNPMKSSVKPRL